MKIRSALVVVSLALGCGVSDPAADSQRKRLELREELTGNLASNRLNVILITIDTLRADRLSSYGSSVKTPNMDRLASEGVLFENASSTVPFTFPAHSSIMTGTYPPFHGVRENVGYYLGDENPTVAETMSEKITPMNQGQGFTANLITSIIVIGASRFGMPVSTTHVSCGSLFGIGIVTRQGRLGMIGKILGAWVTTLPVGAAFGAVSYFAITSF